MGKTEPGVTPTTGTARGQDNYILSRHLPVEVGINRVLIRSATRAGRVRLTATAAGLRSASLTLKSVAAPVTAGLSTMFPEDSQKSDLSRGPTPRQSTVVPRARTIAVAGITAGSNIPSASASHDDNEATTWSSDGRPETAWIEYRFARPEQVSQLSLRLTGWRIRAYPIRITLDGRTVFEGTTPKSLGYINLATTPAIGSRLRIALTGPTTDRDAFGNIVEVKNDKVAASVGADVVPAGWRLSIVEADILGPPPVR
jgi:beta-galactosidase